MRVALLAKASATKAIIRAGYEKFSFDREKREAANSAFASRGVAIPCWIIPITEVAPNSVKRYGKESLSELWKKLDA